jgi:cholesterol transport system auxiliary component
MRQTILTRRAALMGVLTLPAGCGAASALSRAGAQRTTYDLSPAPGPASGPRSSRSLLVAEPEATAVLDSDRIAVKPDALSVAYLPDGRWSDRLPLVLQSLLVRSIAGTGRAGYVGAAGQGPVPDRALLGRIDAFNLRRLDDASFEMRVDVALTVVDDASQRVVATRNFAGSAPVADDRAESAARAAQAVLDGLLPEAGDWVLRRL